jgi:hypothetical protein
VTQVLHLCAANGKEVFVDFLLNKFDLMVNSNVTQGINATDEDGLAPLIVAAATILGHHSTGNT